MQRRTLKQHRAAIWQQLPDFKNLCGRHLTGDICTLVVQEWPAKEFAQIGGEPATKTAAVDNLVADVRRQLHLLNGDKNFDIAWKGFMRELVYEVVLLTYQWWLDKPYNRALLDHWRTVLVGDE